MAKKFHFIKKSLLTLFFVWTALILAFCLFSAYSTYQDAEHIAIEKAKTSVNKDLAYRSWVSSHGGVYVPVTKRTPPNKYLSHIENRDFKANGKNYTLMNPAYTLSQMMNDYTKLYGVKTKITSEKLLNPKNEPDTWERKALKKIATTREQFYEKSDINGEEYLRLMNPMVTKESCLKCHAKQGYEVGDLRGGVSVSIPMKNLDAHASNHILLMIFMFISLWLIGSGFLFFVYKKLRVNFDEKQRMYEQYIYGLVDIVEKRDYYTAGHSKRVAKYAKILAKAMGYDAHTQDFLYKAAMLHDIGKIAIPDNVFLKPYRLNDTEYKMIQEHVNFSYKMIQNIDVFRDISEIIKNHHEKYDGTGYPRGLKGEEMSILDQILSLCDAFDAMTTNRVYKKKKTLQEALEEIKALSGKQFHPDIVHYALQAFDDESLLEANKDETLSSLDIERFEYFFKDPLTHLFNKEYLEIKLNEAEDFHSLYVFTLKNYSSYNKKYGWEEGDKMLMYIASSLFETFTSSDLLFRVCGDDFILLTNKEYDMKELLKPLEEELESFDIGIVSQRHNLKEEKISNIKDLIPQTPF